MPPSQLVSELTARLRPNVEFKVDRIELPVSRHFQRHAALAANQDAGHSSSFTKGTNDCSPRAQVGNKEVCVPIRTRLLVGNLLHSRSWEVQLEGPGGDNFQIPSEGPIEVWE